MLTFYIPKENDRFIGRTRETRRLGEIDEKNEAAIIVIYGRRRVGKTSLIEHYYQKRPILKFEGIQTEPPRQQQLTEFRNRQIELCLRQLSQYLNDANIAYLKLERWSQFFDLLTPVINKHKLVLYFEEMQWLAAYQGDFFAEMKPFWDNQWRHNNDLRVVFSGSSPSFLKEQFLSNKALYQRSQYTIGLDAFSPEEIDEYLKEKSKAGPSEKLTAAMCLGGIPGYLRLLSHKHSVMESIAREAFRRNGVLVEEFEKVFVSSLASSKHYRDIIELLAESRFLSRAQLLEKLKRKKNTAISQGGSLTRILNDLEQCGFIKTYTSIHLKASSKLVRYRINDEYLWFYFCSIKPVLNKINDDVFEEKPMAPMMTQPFRIQMGFAFERWCVKNAKHLAKKMHFDQIDYQYGAFFNRDTAKHEPGFQIDLMYIRKDQTIVIVECKYSQGLINKSAVYEAQEKEERLLSFIPKYQNYTIKHALITTEGAASAVHQALFFDWILTLNHLFD